MSQQKLSEIVICSLLCKLHRADKWILGSDKVKGDVSFELISRQCNLTSLGSVKQNRPIASVGGEDITSGGLGGGYYIDVSKFGSHKKMLA